MGSIGLLSQLGKGDGETLFYFITSMPFTQSETDPAANNILASPVLSRDLSSFSLNMQEFVHLLISALKAKLINIFSIS
jgi:hypothetical protein